MALPKVTAVHKDRIWITPYVENCAVLSYYVVNSGNSLLIFRDNLSVKSSRAKNPKTERLILIVGKELPLLTPY